MNKVPMEVEISYFAAFLAGLFGGVHCVGMCGGIVGALSFGLGPSAQGRPLRALPYLISYNVGRIGSYALAGALVGALGFAALSAAEPRQAQLVLQLVAGAFLIAMGLYLGGWWFGLARLEKAGGLLWRRIEPLGRRLLPVNTPLQALALGVVWGWLPCGLVYSVLIWAIAAGSAAQGALLMLSFGLGTLPNLLAMGFFASRLAAALRNGWVRGAAGVAVILFGVVAIARALL